MSRILTSIHGLKLGLDDRSMLVAPQGLILGSHGSQYAHPGPNITSLFEDFERATLDTADWVLAKGSDVATVNFAKVAGASGLIAATTGATSGTMAGAGVQITTSLDWKANSDMLAFEIRLKLSAITNISMFAGFTNQTAALQAPAIASGVGDGVTFNAADCVGFLFDTGMVDDFLFGVGNKASAAATPINSKIAPVANTFITLRVEVDISGNAKFYINGVGVGSTLMQNAVTPTVALAPVFTCFTKTAASATPTIDYVHVASLRV